MNLHFFLDVSELFFSPVMRWFLVGEKIIFFSMLCILTSCFFGQGQYYWVPYVLLTWNFAICIYFLCYDNLLFCGRNDTILVFVKYTLSAKDWFFISENSCSENGVISRSSNFEARALHCSTFYPFVHCTAPHFIPLFLPVSFYRWISQTWKH